MTCDILQISDLHLGAHNCERKLINKVLRKIKNGSIVTKLLVIAGDLVNSPNLKKLKRKDWKIIHRLRKLQKHCEVILLAGNHDPSKEVIEKEFGLKCQDELVIESGGVKFLLCHGHLYDDFLDKHPIVTVVGDVFYNFSQMIDRSHKVSRFLKRKSKTFIKAITKVGLGVAARAKELGCQKAGHGHNHHKGEYSYDGIEVFDSGTFSEIPSSYLTINNGDVTIHKIWH